MGDIVFADVDHRLNADSHAGPQALPASRLAVVCDLRVFVGRLTDAMSNQIPHDIVAASLGVPLDRCADVSNRVAHPRL